MHWFQEPVSPPNVPRHRDRIVYLAVRRFVDGQPRQLAERATPATPNATPAALPSVPGAYHLLFLDSTLMQMAAGSKSILDQFDAHPDAETLDALFPGAKITPAALADDQPPTIAQACADNQAIGVVTTLPGLGSAGGWIPEHRFRLGRHIRLLRSNRLRFQASPGRPSHRSVPQASVTQQIIGTLDDLGDREVADIQATPGKYGLAPRESLEHVYAIGNGERRPYFGLGRDPSGARVTFVTVFGSAARAGLKLGDLVTAINGQPTLGLSQEQLNLTRDQLMASPNNHVLDVQAADGSKTTITFEAQDIGWYLAQPAIALSASPTPSPAQSMDPTTEQLKHARSGRSRCEIERRCKDRSFEISRSVGVGASRREPRIRGPLSRRRRTRGREPRTVRGCTKQSPTSAVACPAARSARHRSYCVGQHRLCLHKDRVLRQCAHLCEASGRDR